MKLTTISFPELLKEDAEKKSPIHKAIKVSCVSLTLLTFQSEVDSAGTV